MNWTCFVLGHNKGDVTARHKAGDTIVEKPTPEQVKAAVERGATEMMMRVKVKCLRCGKVVNA